MNRDMFRLFRYAATFGNALFVLWMLANGIDEGFRGSTGPQIASYIGLTVLLGLNTMLIYRKV